MCCTLYIQLCSQNFQETDAAVDRIHYLVINITVPRLEAQFGAGVDNCFI
jgi:hypothetical protein